MTHQEGFLAQTKDIFLQVVDIIGETHNAQSGIRPIFGIHVVVTQRGRMALIAFLLEKALIVVPVPAPTEHSMNHNDYFSHASRSNVSISGGVGCIIVWVTTELLDLAA